MVLKKTNCKVKTNFVLNKNDSTTMENGSALSFKVEIAYPVTSSSTPG